MLRALVELWMRTQCGPGDRRPQHHSTICVFERTVEVPLGTKGVFQRTTSYEAVPQYSSRWIKGKGGTVADAIIDLGQKLRIEEPDKLMLAK